MAFDQNKPVSNGTLSSTDVRNNFTHIKNAIAKEHRWDDVNPANTSHRLDQITAVVTGSTQRDTSSGGHDYTTGSGDLKSYYFHVANGVAANTYSLQSLLQELVNRSHRHETELRLSNCNCTSDCNCGNCNCQCGDGE